MNPLGLALFLANPAGAILFLATVSIVSAFKAWAIVFYGTIAGLVGIWLFFRWPRAFWFYAGATTIYIEHRFLGLSFYIEEVLRHAFVH